MKSKAKVESPKQMLEDYYKQDVYAWNELRRQTVMASFIKAASKVPAYQKFLKEHNLSRYQFKNYGTLKDLPYTDKSNYFHKYAVEDFFEQHIKLNQSLITTSTSGSTGEPTYFFRSQELDEQYSLLAEMFLNNGPKGSTLLINCFGMGVWIGGLITYEAFRLASLRNHPVTIIAPGVNKKEIFHALRKLAPNFDNVILSGYPPFIKDILDEARAEKVDMKSINFRFLFAAESFTEGFRDYVGAKANLNNIYTDTLNIYGSAELGAMAFETPFSIFIRRLALENEEVSDKLFKKHKLPTLAQYNSSFVAFEEHNGEVLISAPNVLPFVKYRIGDNGGVYDLIQIENIFAESRINLRQEALKAGIRPLNLPFVYVYERNDLSTTLYGLQVYPQTIKKVLEKKELEPMVTGKFTMITRYNNKSDQYLELNIELKNDVKNSKQIVKKIEKLTIEQLLADNSEYRELYSMIKERCRPKIKLWKYNDPTYFRAGIKQQWVERN